MGAKDTFAPRTSPRRKCTIGGGICLCVAGCILAVVGLLLPGMTRSSYDTAISSPRLDKASAQKAHADSGDSGSSSWQEFVDEGSYDIKAPNVDYYVPHVSNVDEVLSKGVAPIIVDVGPFAFKQYKKKHDYGNDGDDVSWKEEESFGYDESQSCHKNTHPQSRNGNNLAQGGVGNCNSLDDVITTVNAAYLILMKQFQPLGGDEVLVPLFSAMTVGSVGPMAAPANLFIGTAQDMGIMDAGDTTTSSLLDRALNLLAIPAMATSYQNIVSWYQKDAGDDDLDAANTYFVHNYFTASIDSDFEDVAHIHGNIGHFHGAKMASSVLEGDPLEMSQKFADRAGKFEGLWHPNQTFSITYDGSEELPGAHSIAEGSATIALFLQKGNDPSPDADLTAAILQTFGGTRWFFLTAAVSGTFPVLGNAEGGLSIAEELASQISAASGFDETDISMVTNFLAGAMKNACSTLENNAGTCVDTNGLGSSIARLTCPRGSCTPQIGSDGAENRALCAAHQWPNSNEGGCEAQEAGGVPICVYNGMLEPVLPGFECNPAGLADIVAIQSATGAVVKNLGLIPGDKRDQVEMAEVVEAQVNTERLQNGVDAVFSLGFKLDMFSSMHTYSGGKAYMGIAAARQALRLMRGEYDATAQFAPGGPMVDALGPAALEAQLRTELMDILDDTITGQLGAFTDLARASLGVPADGIVPPDTLAAVFHGIKTAVVDQIAPPTAGAVSAAILPLQPQVFGAGMFFKSQLAMGVWGYSMATGGTPFRSPNALQASMANMYIAPKIEILLMSIKGGLEQAAAMAQGALSAQLAQIGHTEAISVAAPTLCEHLTEQALGVRLDRVSMKAVAQYIVDDVARSVLNNQYSADTMSGPFVTRTARELLIEGYDEPIFQLLAALLQLPFPKAPPIVMPMGTEGRITEAGIIAHNAQLHTPCSDPSDESIKAICEGQIVPNEARSDGCNNDKYREDEPQPRRDSQITRWIYSGRREVCGGLLGLVGTTFDEAGKWI